MAVYRKKLIEVALPLEAINKAAAREKSSVIGIRARSSSHESGVGFQPREQSSTCRQRIT